MSETDDLTMTTDADTLAFEEFIRRSNRAFVNGARHDEIYRQAFYAALADERNRTETTAENHAGLVAAITALADDAETPGFWHEDVAWVTVHSLRALLTADHTAALDALLHDAWDKGYREGALDHGGRRFQPGDIDPNLNPYPKEAL